MKQDRFFTNLFKSEKAGSVLLIFCAAASLIAANSGFRFSYVTFWRYSVSGHSIDHWINEGLMTIFFLLIGLELRREMYQGELSSLKNALWPIIAALGGMIVPALIYLFFNFGTNAQSGAGIPMATDIAFAVGVLSLLGNRVPASLKIFLLTLAIVDDLGAILVIAFFYSSGISILYIGLVFAIFIVLVILKKLHVVVLFPYLIGGAIMWYCMLHSGVHATIVGVILAFAIPFQDGDNSSVAYKLQHRLHIPVYFFILPLFALANTCVTIPDHWTTGLLSGSSIGIFTGLVIGKPFGIFLFSGIAVWTGICKLPPELQWKHVMGAGFLAGIGFTMSIFITLLAFDDGAFIDIAKMAILISSIVAGVIGFVWLRIVFRNTTSLRES